MSEPENFLTRWSRRKRVTGEPAEPAPAVETAPAKPAEAGEPDLTAAIRRTPEAADASRPDIDPATLPSLDSIGAQSDISAFLRPGVPGDLRLAALRRAWSADPAIRDFKGLADYDWDFTAPDSMRGFGELDPGTDVKKMLAQMFSEMPRPDAPPSELPKAAEQPTLPPHELSSPTDRATPARAEEPARAADITEPPNTAATENDGIVRREQDIASQDDLAKPDDPQGGRRRPQGSALPQ
jgi:hypothetical protein